MTNVPNSNSIFVDFVPESNGDMLAISYKRFYTLMETKGYKKFWLRQNGVNPKVVDALYKGKNVNVSTIDDLCRLLDCQPCDIMEYVPDDEMKLS